MTDPTCDQCHLYPPRFRVTRTGANAYRLRLCRRCWQSDALRDWLRRAERWAAVS